MREETGKKARERMKRFCRVCPRCDGKACAGEVPGMGGAGTGSSFIHNVKALERIRLVMRSLHNVETAETSTTLFGHRLSVPILTAPVGGVVFNMSEHVGEKEYLRALIEGALASGSLASTGDGELDEIFDSAEAILGSEGVAGIPFIKPWSSTQVRERVTRIEALGVPAFGMDIDAAGLVTLRKVGRAAYPKHPGEIQQISESTDLPFIVKGIMTEEDAKSAVEAGAAGIVVSNHGGRVLDSCEATAEVLPSIAKTVAGGCTILVDGGVRTGTDVFKMLALGADAVLIGRPFAIAAIGGGAQAVEEEFARISEELHHAMRMTGTSSLSDISPNTINIPLKA